MPSFLWRRVVYSATPPLSPVSLQGRSIPWTHWGLTLLDHIVPCLPTPYDKKYMYIRG